MDRNKIRKSIRETRKAIPVSLQKVFAEQAAKRAMQWLVNFEFQSVALYLTNDGELDTQPLIEALWEMEKTVYVPVLHPFCTGYLIFIEYSKSSPMVRNQYGISEPKLELTKLIPVSYLDVIFTPLVAFDELGNRMGMGGGYYDRTLSHIDECRSINIAGFAHECQKIERLPTEAWDVPLRNIITPNHFYSFGGLNKQFPSSCNR